MSVNASHFTELVTKMLPILDAIQELASQPCVLETIERIVEMQTGHAQQRALRYEQVIYSLSLDTFSRLIELNSRHQDRFKSAEVGFQRLDVEEEFKEDIPAAQTSEPSCK